jgi:hypothetical protein
MMHGGDASSFLEEACLGLGGKLVKAEDLQSQDATERSRFAYLIDLSIAARANKGHNFVCADMRPLNEEVAMATASYVVGVNVAPARV